MDTHTHTHTHTQTKGHGDLSSEYAERNAAKKRALYKHDNKRKRFGTACYQRPPEFKGCLTVHLRHDIIWTANLMQQGNFINVFSAPHVSGTYAHHQEHYILSCSIWFSAPSFWVGGGLESCCVGRVYGADGARQHTTYTAALKTTTNPKTRCRKPYAAI